MKRLVFSTLLVFLTCLMVMSVHAQEVDARFLPAGHLEKAAIQAPVFKAAYSQDKAVFDALHYDVYLDVDVDNYLIAGEVKCLGLLDTAATKEINLNLHQLIVDSVHVDGQATSFTHMNGLLTISATSSSLPSDTVSVCIWYQGRPGNDGFGGFFFNPKATFTVGEGLFSDPPSMTRYWIPCHDTPSDKATLDMTIRVRTPLMAVSNGKLVNVQSDAADNSTIYHWRESHPIATYLIALAIGDFTVFGENYISVSGDTIPIEIYVYPEDLEKARTDFAALPQMMAFFEQRFGSYPFDRYSMVEVPMRGAMEHQTMTSYSDRWVTGDNRNDAVVAHELAHHWWGDLVTLSDWREIWLNEGFASYCEALYSEWLHGSTGLQSTMKTFADEYFLEDARLSAFPIYDPDYLWGATIYEKGAWVLHMLRWTIGDSAFWRTMRSYAETYAYKNATIPDFKQIAESESGQSLDWFFEQWIYKLGYPKFYNGWDWSRDSDGNYIIDISIDQVQRNALVFTMPVEIQLKTESSSYLDTIWVSEESQNFTFTTRERPIEFVFDPNNWLLKKADVTSFPLPESFEIGKYALAQNYPNPFYRHGSLAATTIEFQIGYADAPAQTALLIYDVQGRLVKTLFKGKLTPGLRAVTWDGYDEQGRRAANGIYIYVLETEKRTLAKRMVLLR